MCTGSNGLRRSGIRPGGVRRPVTRSGRFPRLDGMKLPTLFRRPAAPSSQVLKRPDAQDQVEKLMAESLRMLGQVCAKVADLIEAQRLERQGYADQQRYLRRVDAPAADAAPREPAAREE